MKKGDEKMTDMILDFNDMKNQYICGDCLSVLSSVPDNSIDLIMTSPPYADQIKDYGNVVKKIKPIQI